ncbi:PcfJ domain-containing protein [Leptospira yasudae]|uniref:PcfJ domain-containing protein n=1 Tax=Leptospira yasudae TaxID=2202201 RepID=UPI001C4FA2DE|nr:PcfJ domain-containing protein [Leptospira yasudae]MBW0435667.1 PcfJ domain-containing protein [Leptospira yasudae]
MIFALEFCIKNPESILTVVPKDFEEIRERLPFRKQKEVAAFWGFHPSSLKVLGRITESAVRKGYLKPFQNLYSIPVFQKAFHHLPIINEFILQFFNYALSKGWNEKWESLFLKDLSIRFSDSNFKKEDYEGAFQLYEEVKRFSPQWKIRSLEHLLGLEQEMIRKIQKNEFNGPDQPYPTPPMEKEDWIEPIDSRKELFLESRIQHNCIFSYDARILEGKYYIYRIFFPERCTLSLFHINGDWYLDQVAAAFNKEAKAETLKKVEEWRMQNGVFVLGDAFRLGIPPDWIFAR